MFLVKLDNSQKYFQYVTNDMSMLNSSVIRVFKKEYPLGSTPDLAEVVSGEIDFHVHVVLRWGIEAGYWEKVGKAPAPEKIDVLFRDSEDYGENIVDISHRWYVWRIGGKFRYVGKLKGENRLAEIGVVKNPESVFNRIKTGEYGGCYPGFE